MQIEDYILLMVHYIDERFQLVKANLIKQLPRLKHIKYLSGNPPFRAMERIDSGNGCCHQSVTDSLLAESSRVPSLRAECASHGWAEYRDSACNGRL